MDLGLRDYCSTFQLQRDLHGRRQSGEILDTLILVEHPACLTLGRSAHLENIRADATGLRRRGIAVYETDRGGDVTYHGPGQLVLYAIIDLEGYGRDVHEHVRRLEQVVIEVIASYGVYGTRVEEYPGVWTSGGKIAAIGVAARRWVTLHGVALNVSPDMTHFSCIVPCGISDRPVVSLAELLGESVDMAEVKARAMASFERVFQVSLFAGDERYLPPRVDQRDRRQGGHNG